MKDFKPTYLYIKQHTITGKSYFGKTTRPDPEKYMGSGKHWIRHYKYHGKEHVTTIWFCLFYDKEECNKFALMFSEQQDIVKSKEWLNQIVETGLDWYQDGSSGYIMSEEHKKKIGYANRGRTFKTQPGGTTKFEKGGTPHNKGKVGKPWTEERRAKQLESNKNRVKAPKKQRMNKEELSEFRKQFSGENHPQFGKEKSVETRQKISETLKARNKLKEHHA
jgi:hypothetical protein